MARLGAVRSRSRAATSIRRSSRHHRRGRVVGPYDDEKLGFYKIAPHITTRLVGGVLDVFTIR